MYALYEEISKGYSVRIHVFDDLNKAVAYMEDIAYMHGKLFIEKIGK